jgi:monoamine oxidase
MYELMPRSFSRVTFSISISAAAQIARFGNIVAKPHERLHFAGEHTAVLQQGMEDTMKSGERAAFEIFDRA